MGSAHGKEADMTDITPEQRAAAMERAAATSKAALAHMRFTKIAVWVQLVLLAVIAAGVWVR